MKIHKDLEVWKKSMELVENIYRLTCKFPKNEQYGLISQMRRSAVSIPSNIAEGAARNSHREFIQFLYISLGSLSEIETQLSLAQRLSYVRDGEILTDIDQIRKMTAGLINYLKGRSSRA
jgi:four helix bundle protein